MEAGTCRPSEARYGWRAHVTDPLRTLDRAIGALVGRAGVILMDDEGREHYAHDADGVYRSASCIKLPILMTLFVEAAEGRLSLDELIPVTPIVEGSGVLRHLRDVSALTLRDHAALMTLVSDNTATNRVIERVGIDRVNAKLEAWGCTSTRLRRKMFDTRAEAAGLRNEMTARETAALLLRLVRGELVDRATSGIVLGILEHATEGGRLRRYLPYDAYVAHKLGTLGGVRNDVGVLRVDRSVVAVGFTNDLEDEAAGDVILGLLGWAAYRLAGAPVPDEPPALMVGAE
jgi:beta-lactamase class A